MASKAKLICVVGARPNYMKMGPILRACAALDPALETLLVHTGQHYDHAMNAKLFSDLGLPAADINLEVGSASHAVQTAEIMKRFEAVLDAHPAAAVLVVGDVNSTIACALVATKKSIPVAHVEAGLRSFDRAMPEEINRVLTDQIADLLYTTERSAEENLLREGVAGERIVFAGNVMIDSLLAHRERATPARDTFASAGLPDLDDAQGFALVTLHRPSNVDDPDTLAALVAGLIEASARLPLVFAIHPRTRSNLERFALMPRLLSGRIHLLPPVGYLEMLGLMAEARVVMTDSGGVQEETTALGVPCLTIRDNTERPITVEQGTNTLVGTEPRAILAALDAVVASGGKAGRVPELWDGEAATRIAQHLAGWLAARGRI
ncbi:UDP-N-acetylglucosamine 2-epimerase (non-hydrolyzing) [Niveibacterium sp. SC-1]|uniref:non-hydrolyzing UDP-N-acetylglucosamine 2-epimerase n=2 Tax=Niveibacterium sp. SC-1 TaxID=3135646 RepID=UPI00311F99E0